MTETTGAVSRRGALPDSSRYELLAKIASGGTATVYVGRLTGAVGFSRLVAIKRAHPHLLEAPHTRRMLVEEAVLASKIHHANVVAVLDVEETSDEILLVMDYVEGGSLADLLAAAPAEGTRVPAAVAVRILLDACAGLHAVHSLCDDEGRPLGLVHRDVSPQNVLVGVDGIARLTDFGLAKLVEPGNSATTGVLRGKVAYLAPEYVEGAPCTVASDTFAMGVVAWEALTNQRLFRGQNEADTLRRVVGFAAPPVSSLAADVPHSFDPILAKALDKSPSRRFASVLEFSQALEEVARRAGTCAPQADVGRYVRQVVEHDLKVRRERLRSAVFADAVTRDTVSMVHGMPPLETSRVGEPTLEASVMSIVPPVPPPFLREDESGAVTIRREPAANLRTRPSHSKVVWSMVTAGVLLGSVVLVWRSRATPSPANPPPMAIANDSPAMASEGQPDRARDDEATPVTAPANAELAAGSAPSKPSAIAKKQVDDPRPSRAPRTRAPATAEAAPQHPPTATAKPVANSRLENPYRARLEKLP